MRLLHQGRQGHSLTAPPDPCRFRGGWFAVVAVDLWMDVDQMTRHYAEGYVSTLGPVFTGAPETSIRRNAGSDRIEW